MLFKLPFSRVIIIESVWNSVLMVLRLQTRFFGLLKTQYYFLDVFLWKLQIGRHINQQHLNQNFIRNSNILKYTIMNLFSFFFYSIDWEKRFSLNRIKINKRLYNI